MPQTPHIEHHFTASNTVRDVVIGMSDGLTVPFALAAGLSGSVYSTGVIVIAGLAEIAAGSISMGLGGYLAARSDAEHYLGEKAREEQEIRDVPETEAGEVQQILRAYGLKDEKAVVVTAALRKRPESWIDFMMRFELGLEKPDPRRALTSALTIAGAYAAGGFVPLSPYMLLHTARSGLLTSCLVTIAALAVFGSIKARFTGAKPLRSGLQTMLIGGLAAAAAFLVAKLIA
jgi:VIT1/CCC1 family predicted Fe2+/Mn2+ transporter